MIRGKSGCYSDSRVRLTRVSLRAGCAAARVRRGASPRGYHALMNSSRNHASSSRWRCAPCPMKPGGAARGSLLRARLAAARPPRRRSRLHRPRKEIHDPCPVGRRGHFNRLGVAGPRHNPELALRRNPRGDAPAELQRHIDIILPVHDQRRRPSFWAARAKSTRSSRWRTNSRTGSQERLSSASIAGRAPPVGCCRAPTRESKALRQPFAARLPRPC